MRTFFVHIRSVSICLFALVLLTQMAAPQQKGGAASEPVAGIGGGQPLGDYLPLTTWRTQLLLFRDNPNLLTDDAVFPNLLEEITEEANAWRALDNVGRDPITKRQVPNQPKKFIFEWQKYIDQQPDLARGPLMDVFMREDADWSFVKRENGWDNNPTNIVDVLLFSKEKVANRDAQFAARELMPVYRKHLDLAISKAPAKLVFNVALPTAYFDFATNTFRFPTKATMASNAKHEFVDKIALLSPLYSGQKIPAAVVGKANYNVGSPDYQNVRLDRLTTPRAPGSRGGGGPDIWRKNMEWKPVSSLVAFSFDRRLEMKGFPVDISKAEDLSKKMAVFTARIYIDVEHDYSFLDTNHLESFLAARIQKVEVLGPQKEVLATLAGASFPAPGPVGSAPEKGQRK